ncbi:MAG: ABC transporter ATP-binding protein/permease [Clostridia bacterium]|nr:ABC transporter ATP-binding protein/permease [Clostridia bacterium]
MLQIKNISKKYTTGELVQIALNDVSLNFRNNEFVSILGPSGSGKTTLLNIVGGLDRYDSGDLIINNVSTKDYKDRDWDSYRNHTVGFVFQSYNLIPHQTVLANVELALTIGGISKAERKKRALEALDKVGLKDQAHKKPNQMSGGQMQRVAIARALVNNPDILLADEPTGALDTETSVQVMELLKEVAKDRLVIMVTHNPELAETYSTRIVKLRDGKIIDDSNPFIVDEKKREKPKYKNLGKASMSIMTALSLSFNNLLTKKGRTILTAFAGSIGIIGIALILSLSTGFQNYIDKIQEDTLTSYPLTITAETADATSMMLSMVPNGEGETKEGVVKENQNFTNMFAKIGENDLTTFKYYLEDDSKQVDSMVSLTQYKYSINPLIYTKNVNNEVTKLNPSEILAAMYGDSIMSMASSNVSVFTEMIDDESMLLSQYKMLKGRWPKEYNEVILMLPSENEVSDLLLYSLGLRDAEELEDMITAIMEGKATENTKEPLELTYDELMQIPLKLINASDTYKYNSKYKVYEDMTDDEKFMENVYNNALSLNIVGIVAPKDSSNASNLTSGVLYKKELTEYVIDQAANSEIVKKQLENKNINVFSNKYFDDEEKESGLDFDDMISIDTDMLSSAFGVKIDEETISKMTEGYMGEISSAITTDTTKAEKAFTDTLTSLTKGLLNSYIDKSEIVGMATLKLSEVPSIVNEYMESTEAITLLGKLEADYVIPKETFATMYTQLITGFLQQYVTMMDKSSADPTAMLVKDAVDTMTAAFTTQEMITTTAKTMAGKMTEATMQKTILTSVGELSAKLMSSMANAFNVDENKIAKAFKFEMDEDEMKRLFQAMTTTTTKSADSNLISLGYQNIDEPTSISFYFKDFESKERFIDFLDEYNDKMEKEDDEKVIKYTDITGILMSSVKVIVDSVSYVLIAFVSISLIVSSIMIGIITYISVLERTKEIGVLRAIGASKKNISSIFNAETFIVGLFAGLLGIGVSLLLLFPINSVIHAVTNNMNITAVLPTEGAIVLVILSVILTLIGGLIPSKQAAKKDPVLALRSE